MAYVLCKIELDFLRRTYSRLDSSYLDKFKAENSTKCF